MFGDDAGSGPAGQADAEDFPVAAPEFLNELDDFEARGSAGGQDRGLESLAEGVGHGMKESMAAGFGRESSLARQMLWESRWEFKDFGGPLIVPWTRLA